MEKGEDLVIGLKVCLVRRTSRVSAAMAIPTAPLRPILALVCVPAS